MSLRDWSLLIFLSILWGGSFFFVRVALDDLPPLTLVLSRVLIGAAVLAVVIRISGEALPRRPMVWFTLAVMALLNNVIPFSLIFWGQTAIPAGLAAILNATTPLFTVVVMHLFTTDDRASPNKAAGVALGFLGVVVLVGPAALGRLDTPLWAIAACLAATLSYAFSGLWGRRIKALGISPTITAWAQLSVTTVVMTPIVALVDRPWTLAMPGMPAILAVLALAILSTALAYIIFFRLLATAGPSNLLLVTFLIPVSTILLTSLFLGERLAPTHFAGMALIGLGLAAIDGRLWRRMVGAKGS
ncbi:DMT family transporter [Phreatobacter oligotrophus]|uniref:EamA domain-containing membrane protein RarD n=1 Tax=Phreatobacter oligotrophus TaxID=1122261 RepID=A0A2T4ZEL8_9HYPH|nr:DMT family transporter [Phreatobacter oligotrophus]PTM60313.1 EamA domain-containing membrane protein RarD [Phreatobacter oligotrophus]